MSSPKERLSDLRGQEYYAEFGRIWQEVRNDFLDARQACVESTGGFTLGNLVSLVDVYRLPFKPTVLALEKEDVLQSGTWDYLEANGFSLKKLREHLLRERSGNV